MSHFTITIQAVGNRQSKDHLPETIELLNINLHTINMPYILNALLKMPSIETIAGELVELFLDKDSKQ